MKRLLLSLLVISVLFFACTKTVTPPVTQDGQMRDGKWKISKSMITLKQFNGKPKTMQYDAYRKVCIKDNYLKFDSLNRGSIRNGGVSCSVGDADSIGFIWVLKNNGKGIDLLNCYTLVDSIQQTIYLDPADNIYKPHYDSASSYISNLYNAVISDFTESSFNLEYDLNAQYLDTTAAKGGSPTSPVTLPDVFHFKITYTK